jgi:phage-related holin
MPHVIRTKLILFVSLTLIVAVLYLVAVGYMKGELDLLWICLIILFTVSTYVGSVLAYLTGLFTNSYLLDGKILMQFAIAVVPVLIAETLLSFYYTTSNYTIFYIAGLGVLLVAASMMILKGLENRWKGIMFRIA